MLSKAITRRVTYLSNQASKYNIRSRQALSHKDIRKYKSVRQQQFFLKRPYGTQTKDTSQKISNRLASQTDLQNIIRKWAIQENWNPGVYESAALYAADPKGFHILEVNNKPVASLAAVKYSKKLGFLGLYMVKPELRGLGYGKKLWDTALLHLNDCETIGLNGVLTQTENYKKSGFTPAFLSTRWIGNTKTMFFKNNDLTEKIAIKSLKDIVALVDYDTSVFSVSRAKFLEKWIKIPESQTLVAYDGDKLKGYGVLSKTNEGYKVAPLFADDIEIAKKILEGLITCIKTNERIFIDIPDINVSGESLIKHYGFSRGFSVLRMYKGKTPNFDNQKMFGLTTLEIG